jgi:hypothetical protein
MYSLNESLMTKKLTLTENSGYVIALLSKTRSPFMIGTETISAVGNKKYHHITILSKQTSKASIKFNKNI